MSVVVIVDLMTESAMVLSSYRIYRSSREGGMLPGCSEHKHTECLIRSCINLGLWNVDVSPLAALAPLFLLTITLLTNTVPKLIPVLPGL